MGLGLDKMGIGLDKMGIGLDKMVLVLIRCLNLDFSTVAQWVKNPTRCP